jgi:phosphinothricin acetyltransferase
LQSKSLVHKDTNLQRFILPSLNSFITFGKQFIHQMKIQIRAYQTEDTQAILDIINYNIVHSTALYDYAIRSYEQQEAILEDKINKGFPVIVAELEGVVIGFSMYSEFRFREAYKFTVEHSVYVAEKYNGKGIGKILLSELILLAKAQGLHTMIGVIDSENQSSIAFHEQFGFETVGIVKESGFKFNRWLDSVFMQLLLK